MQEQHQLLWQLKENYIQSINFDTNEILNRLLGFRIKWNYKILTKEIHQKPQCWQNNYLNWVYTIENILTIILKKVMKNALTKIVGRLHNLGWSWMDKRFSVQISLISMISKVLEIKEEETSVVIKKTTKYAGKQQLADLDWIDICFLL